MLMTSQSRLGAFSPIVGYSRAITAALWKQGWNMLRGSIPCSVLMIVSKVDKAVEVNGCWIILFMNRQRKHEALLFSFLFGIRNGFISKQ